MMIRNYADLIEHQNMISFLYRAAWAVRLLAYIGLYAGVFYATDKNGWACAAVCFAWVIQPRKDF